MKNQFIAVIGAGAMGAPMARRLLASNAKVTVCDRNPTAVASLTALGANAAITPAACASADVILVVVATADQVRDVVMGPQGVLAGVIAHRSPIVVVMSTVSAEILEELAQQLQSSGLRLVDAPISGGMRAAENGVLTMLTGGDERDIESLDSVFSVLATTRIHCGRLGSAQTLKILNNSLGVSVAVIAGEVYRLAIERGIDPARVSEVLEACSGRNARSKDPTGPRAGYAELAQTRGVYAGLGEIMRKDLGLAVDMASRTEGTYPALHALQSLIRSLGDETFDNWRRVAELPPDAS